MKNQNKDEHIDDLFKEINHAEKAEINLKQEDETEEETSKIREEVRAKSLTDWSQYDPKSDVDETDENKKKKSVAREILEYVLIFAITFLVVNFIHKNVFTPVSVDGASMEPTLMDKDYVFLWELGDYRRFDIIVFQATEQDYYVKRIIGLPGDEVRYENDILYINNQQVTEQFLDEGKEELIYNGVFTSDLTMEQVCGRTNFEEGKSCENQKIPKGYYLVMGDNRPISHDSEEIGLIKEDSILGKAEFVLYPFDRFGTID